MKTLYTCAKATLIVLLAISFINSAHAQYSDDDAGSGESAFSKDYIIKIISLPDSSEIYLDGKLVGYTPAIIKDKFSFINKSKYELKISKKGFNDKLIYYSSKPDSKFTVVNDNLKRNNSGPDSIPYLRFGFDKMIFDIKDGTKIGEITYRGSIKTYKWESSSVTGTYNFNRVAEDKIEAFGLNVLNRTKLFANELEQKAPDLMIGAELKNISISNVQQRKDSFDCHMEIEWQFFSAKQNKIVGSMLSKGDFRVEKNDDSQFLLSGAFESAIDRMLYSRDFLNIVKNFGRNRFTNNHIGEDVFLKIPKEQIYANNTQMINSVLKSVVTVKAVDELSWGSGFIISDDGYIITNHHVVANEKTMNVVFTSGITLPAEIVAYDQDFDVALLKVKGAGFNPLKLSNSDSATIGEDVIAIGTPKDLKFGQTVSKGIISAKRKLDDHDYLQTDVSINPGNSGGPLVNSKGEVLAIVTLKQNDAEGIGFTIPINVAISKLKIKFK
jgi:serine protease Do